MFGLSLFELIILLVAFLLVVAVPVGALVAVIVIARRTGAGGFKTPLVYGTPTIVHTFGPSDTPITGSAKWSGNELEVGAAEAGPLRLFELPLSGIDQAMITYRFRIQTDELKSNVYPEMWCRVAGVGEFFSRGLNQKVRGTNNWLSVEAPFYLKQGQVADLLKLNLVFEGAGSVRLSNIEVLSTPLEAQAS